MTRIINLGGGNYNACINGDYIQGDRIQESSQEQEVVTIEVKAEIVNSETDPETLYTNGGTYTESIDGYIIAGDYIE